MLLLPDAGRLCPPLMPWEHLIGSADKPGETGDSLGYGGNLS